MNGTHYLATFQHGYQAQDREGEMSVHERDEASLSGVCSNVSSSLAMGSLHRIFYPIISEEQKQSHRVKWIRLHPLEMVERIMSMAEQRDLARSGANMVNAGALTETMVATTSPRWSHNNAESLVSSILGEPREADSNSIRAVSNSEQLLSASVGNSTQDDSSTITRGTVVSRHQDGHGSCHINVDMLSNAMKPPSDKEKNETFQSNMTHWLKQNWTNPFPDTEALNSLATYLIQIQCIVVKAKDAQLFVGKSSDEQQRSMMKITIKKIETYLVNVRLRRWRKSIEDAFDLRRPSYLLLEDSLRLFEGKTLRQVEGWNPDELFAHHSRYSLPLKAWKRKKKKVVKKQKRSANGAIAVRAGNATPKRQRVASSHHTGTDSKSPMELAAGDGLVELAKGMRVLSTKASPSNVVVKVGGVGLSPIDFNCGVSPAALGSEARNKMRNGTFF